MRTSLKLALALAATWPPPTASPAPRPTGSHRDRRRRSTSTIRADRAGAVPVARRRLRGLPPRRRQAVRRWPRHADADGHDLLDQHHARSGYRHRCHDYADFERAVRRGIPRRPAAVSGDAVCLVRDRQRYRDQGAVRLLHGLGAAGETGQRRQHDSVAGQHALAAGLVAAAVRTPAQLQPGSGAGCRPAARCRTGGRPGPLRRLPHARPGLPGKGDGR
jgi:hypothetical protein